MSIREIIAVGLIVWGVAQIIQRRRRTWGGYQPPPEAHVIVEHYATPERETEAESQFCPRCGSPLNDGPYRESDGLPSEGFCRRCGHHRRCPECSHYWY